VPTVVAEEKHMGSRAVVIACRDGAAARERFGVEAGEVGVILTRTGRPFFRDRATETSLLDRVRAALTACDFWARHGTTWVCLDAELMPWSAKAVELLKTQYAPAGIAARVSLTTTVASLGRAAERLPAEARADAEALRAEYAAKLANAADFVTAYRRYCRPVATLDDYKLAPFHLLATEGATHADKTHRWHLDELVRVCEADPGVLLATANRVVELGDPASEAAVTAWWEELTAAGGEGVVFKPLDFVTRGPNGVVQPAIKCRGREYLRIIYGPDYTAPENLGRLRKRAVSRKRALASAEFALGVEGLERFARREPLRRVHECAFGVLALESEPIDPRL
jgi:protein phosphatase